jgi:hypothetical protein
MTNAISELLPWLIDAESAVLDRGLVVGVYRDGILVSARGREPQMCDHLAGSLSTAVAEGDEVFVWLPASTDDRGIILGGIRAAAPVAPVAETPDELVVEAKSSLVLRVGDGSITIRDDGKILIKGKDLVSHAQRMNRIKGGAVSIN